MSINAYEALVDEVNKLNDIEVSYLLRCVQTLQANKKTCQNCTREINGSRCSALKDRDYPFEKYGECWAWTDEPEVEARVKKDVEDYAGHWIRTLQV